MLSNFSSALIVEDRQRTSNLFYLLKNKNTILQLWYSNKIYKTKIIKINNDTAVLYVSNFDQKLEEISELFFEILNEYYHCKIKILKVDLNQIIFYFPEKLFYVKNRKYPRVKFNDLFIQFNLSYSNLFYFREKKINLQNKYPYFITEVKKDIPSLKQIYQMLINNIKKIANHFSIVTFRKRLPESYTIYEKTLLKTQKTIFIEDVTRADSYIEELSSSVLSNLLNYYKTLVADIGELNASRKIEELRKEDSKSFLISYLMSPIHIYQNIIGYVKIETNQFQKYRIHRLLAEEFHNICDIFSYGLTKINIWKSYYNREAEKTRVLNISTDGMLIEIFNQVLFQYLKKFPYLKIRLPILGQELEFRAEIMRFFKKGGGYYLGIHIFKGTPGDMSLLKEYIYKNLQYSFF